MSVNFSTIQPMSQATISKAPAYSKTAAQPAASSPINYQAPKQKKSRWFLKTLIAAAVVLGGAALLRGKVGVFKDFDVAAKLADDAKFLDKVKHYGKKAVAVVGDFTKDYAMKGYNWVKNLFTKKPATPAA